MVTLGALKMYFHENIQTDSTITETTKDKNMDSLLLQLALFSSLESPVVFLEESVVGTDWHTYLCMCTELHMASQCTLTPMLTCGCGAISRSWVIPSHLLSTSRFPFSCTPVYEPHL